MADRGLQAARTPLSWGWLALVVGGLLLALIAVVSLALLAQTRRIARIAELRERERDRAEGLQRATEERFQSAFESAPVGMVVHDVDGRVASANDAYAEIVGLPVEALLGQPTAQHLHRSDLAAHQAEIDALRAGTLDRLHLECRLLRPDGEVRWVGIHLTQLGDEEPVLLAHVADVTHRKAIERQRESVLEESCRQAEQLQELDALREQFVALATHELRSPLTTITGYVDLLLEDRDRMPADHAAFLDTIARTSGQLLELAANLLDLSRLQDRGTRLFERFFRASTATDRQILGSGLGLAITKGLVDAHHGHLDVVHHAQGTSFVISLPVLASAPTRAELGRRS